MLEARYSYYRSGRDKRTLHHASCPQVNIATRLLRRVRPWKWAENRTDREMVTLIRGLKFRPCRSCHPFVRGPIEREYL